MILKKNGKVKLPVITKRTRPVFPERNMCPVCASPLTDPNSFFCLMGGAMKQVNKNMKEMSGDLSGFLDMHFYGSSGKGKGPFRGKSSYKEIVKDSTNGQFDLVFCSPDCFRKFINAIIDEMEGELSGKNKKQ